MANIRLRTNKYYGVKAIKLDAIEGGGCLFTEVDESSKSNVLTTYASILVFSDFSGIKIPNVVDESSASVLLANDIYGVRVPDIISETIVSVELL